MSSERSNESDDAAQLDDGQMLRCHSGLRLERATYGVFEPGRFAKSTRGPDTQHWAYLMFTLGF